MAKPAPISIPTQAIGSSPRPVDLIERVARGDSEDAKPAPRYEVTLPDTIKWFEAWASGRYGSIIMSAHTACMGFQTRPRMVSKFHSQTVIRAACRPSHAALSVKGHPQLRTRQELALAPRSRLISYFLIEARCDLFRVATGWGHQLL
jgi:hypothetical protein